MKNSRLISAAFLISILCIISSIYAGKLIELNHINIYEFREINQSDGLPLLPDNRSECNYLFYYDDTATSVLAWNLPNPGTVDMYLTRFSVPEGFVCTLNTAWVLLAGEYMTGNPDLMVYLYSDDGTGLPDVVLDSGLIEYENLYTTGLQWVGASFPGVDWIFNSGDQYHLGYQTIGGEGDTLVLISDKATGPNNGEQRSSLRHDGGFTFIDNVFSEDYSFLMQSYNCCYEDLQVTGACCDLISGACEMKSEADCSGFFELYNGDGTDCSAITCPEPAPPCEESNISVCVDGIVSPHGYSLDEVTCGQDFIILMRFRNLSGQELTGFNHGFKIYSDDGTCWSPLDFDTTGGIGDYIFPGPIITPNGFTGCDADTFGFSGNSSFPPHIPNGYDDVVLGIKTSVDCQYEGSTICIDSSFVPPTGMWMWSLTSSSIMPSWGGPYCYDVVTCCNHDGIRGDTDASNEINVGDLTFLVNYIFKGGAESVCQVEGDVNSDGIILLDDLVVMVNYIFKGGHPPDPC